MWKTLLHGCFSRFLNCTNATKSRNASRISFLREKSPARYTPSGSFDREDEHIGRVTEGNWRYDMNEYNGMIATELGGSNNYTRHCKNIRDNFCLYFNISGKVPWQDKFA